MKVKNNIASNLPLLGLSFVLSMSLFLFVQMQSAPVKGSISVTIPVLIKRNYSPNLYPVLLTTGVTVNVDGPANEVNRLTANTSLAKATIDLTGATPGLHQFPILLSRVNSLNGLTMKPIQKLAKVQIYRIIQKTVPVTAVLEHQFPQKGVILDKVELRPDQVTLTGPENLLDSATAQVILDLSEDNPNKEVASKVRVFDKNHATLSEVKSNPDQVVAAFSTHPAPDQKQLVLNVNFIGKLPINTAVINWSITPQAITVTGKSNTLAHIATATVNVDLRGLTSTKTFILHPTLPPGVKAFGKSEVKVYVEVGSESTPQNNAPKQSISSPPLGNTTKP